MCGSREGHRDRGQCGCGCACGRFFHRHYYQRQEEREWLEEYRDGLKKELAGVEERLRELKK